MYCTVRKYNFHILEKKQYHGFTLLELLVVILIMGVLAALSLPSFLRQVGNSRTTEAKYILGIINRTQQAHRLEFGTFGELGNYFLNADPINLPGQITLEATSLTDANGDGQPDNQLAVNLQPEFYEFTDGRDTTNIPAITSVPLGIVDSTIAEAFAVSIGQFQNDILDYAAQVSQSNNGSFSSIICEESQINAVAIGGTGPTGNGATGGTLATACSSGVEVQ